MKARMRKESAGPVFALVIFWFAVEYLRPQDYVEFIAVLRPALIVLVGIFLAWFMRGDKSALNDGLIRGYIVFIVLGLMSALFARNLYWVVLNNIALVSALMGGVLPFIAFMDRPDLLKRFFAWWVLFNAVVAIGGIIRGGTGSGGFMGDENDLALTLAVALPFAYFLGTHAKRSTVTRALFIVAGLLLVAGIVVTRSRGGFLGMVMAAFAIVVFSRYRVRNFLLVSVIAGIAVIILTQARVTDPIAGDPNDPNFRQRHAQSYWDEMSSIRDAQDATRQSRLYFWRRGWEIFLDNPVFGVGTGNYGWIVEDYERNDPTLPLGHAMSGGRVAHSIYFTLIPEYGIVGTSLFIGLTVGVWRRFGRARRQLKSIHSEEAEVVTALSRAGSAGLLAYLVSGAFLSVLYYPHFWYLLGFAITLDHVAARLAPEPVKSPRLNRLQTGEARSRA